MKLNLNGLGKFDYIGSLLIRVGAGALAAFHGFPALRGGPDVWNQVGSYTAIARFDPMLFTAAGATAAVIQFLGGLFLIAGLFTRGTSLLLTIVTGFAFANAVSANPLSLESFAYFQLLFLFLGLVFVGPGRVSVDRRGL